MLDTPPSCIAFLESTSLRGTRPLAIFDRIPGLCIISIIMMVFSIGDGLTCLPFRVLYSPSDAGEIHSKNRIDDEKKIWRQGTQTEEDAQSGGLLEKVLHILCQIVPSRVTKELRQNSWTSKR